MPSSRLIGVGVFVVGGLLLFAVGLFMIGERRMMFTDQFDIYTEYEDIGGLQSGATVRVAGMNAGEVTEIQVPRGPAERFRVRMRVRADLNPIVRTDSVTSIQTDGLVGNKFVRIEAGTADAPMASAETVLPSEEPFDIGDLLRRASETVDTIQATIKDLSGDLEETIQLVNGTVSQADALIDDISDDVKAITDSGQRIARNVNRIVEDLQAGRGTAGRLLKDDELYQRAVNIASEAEATMTNVKAATRDAQEMVANLRTDLGPRGDQAQSVVADLRETVTSAREAISDLAENAEALKRNWFFRGFFRDRGYYDLNDLTLAEYRSGALEAADRRPLRIWLRGPLVFTEDDRGLALSDEGKARLDSAMAEFLRYPRTSPLIVEGYAVDGFGVEPFLRARERAEQVREYLVERFRLTPGRVGIMPIGTGAIDSPDGNHWNGVALTLFTDPALRQRDLGAVAQ